MTGAPGVTARKVRHLREITGCGLLEAKHALETQSALAQLQDLQANGTLEQKVDFLLSRLQSSLTGRRHPADAQLMELASKVLLDNDEPSPEPGMAP